MVEAASRTVSRPGRMQIDTVDGFGGRSAELYAALTSKAVAGKERKYSERPSATMTTATAKLLGLRLLLLAAVVMATKALPPQTNIRQITNRL